MNRFAAVLLVAVASAGARAQEDRAAAAYSALQQGSGDSRAQVRTMLDALHAARLDHLGTVALSTLLGSENAPVREAASAELQARAADSGLALALLLRAPDSAGLAPAVAVRVARAHLERALVIAPPEEGSAFGPIDDGRVTPAAATDAVEPVVSPGRKLAVAELELARKAASAVPREDPVAGEAHEVAALAALAEGDLRAAEAAFDVVATSPERDAASDARRQRAVLQLARLAYTRGDDARAQSLYGRISRAAPEWLDALFESSWSHFRRGQDEKALGNLLTLHAPFFQGRYYPESHILKALLLYQNCRYADARRALADFDARYHGLHDGLAAALVALPSAQAAVEAVSRGGTQIPPAARDEVARIAAAPELHVGMTQVAQMTVELDSIEARPAAFQRSAFALAAVPRLRAARLDLLQSVGERLRARIDSERAELRELVGQALRLDFEIAGREKEIAAEPSEGKPVVQRRTRPQLDDDEELWPFEGEYWRDELGSYRFQLGRRCAPAKKPGTEQVLVPAPAKPQVGAAP
jgi:hypothetical protein